MLAVYPGPPAKSAKELIALAKSKPGEINNAPSQTGSLGHLANALFPYRAGVTLNPVLDRSSAQAGMDAVAGRIEMQFGTLPPAIPLIREGKPRALHHGAGQVARRRDWHGAAHRNELSDAASS